MPTSDEIGRYPKQPSSPEHQQLAFRHLIALQQVKKLKAALQSLFERDPLCQCDNCGANLNWREIVEEATRDAD